MVRVIVPLSIMDRAAIRLSRPSFRPLPSQLPLTIPAIPRYPRYPTIYSPCRRPVLRSSPLRYTTLCAGSSARAGSVRDGHNSIPTLETHCRRSSRPRESWCFRDLKMRWQECCGFSTTTVFRSSREEPVRACREVPLPGPILCSSRSRG